MNMSFLSTLFSPILAPRRWPYLQSHRLLSKTSESWQPLPPPPSLKHIDTPGDKAAARAWVAEFKKHDIPRSLVHFSFSRSSGPGGQNVNKLNTKASLRCDVNAPWVPAWARSVLRKSTYYVSSADDIQITSTIHRSQVQNVKECLSQLRALLIAASSAPIKKDPTKEQQEKVKNLERSAKTARRKEKTFRSGVKQRRRTRDWD